MIYLLLLLFVPTQQKIECEKLIEKDCTDRTYCKCKLKQDQISCAQDQACAFNSVCENFIGCQAYYNYKDSPIIDDKDYCERISINCVSLPDSDICEDKPSSCNFITNQEQCGKIAPRSGVRSSCEFKGCNNAQLTYYSEKNCLNYNSGCKYNGFQCVDQLEPCNTRQIKSSTDCNKFISNTGRCQAITNSAFCERASCYQYYGTSLEQCGQYYGKTGQQCFYDKNLFSELCLEYDYSLQIKQCFENEQNSSCEQYLSISKCFNINTIIYDQTIDFCFPYTIDKKYQQYRVDCSKHIEKAVCNQAKNQSKKQCQYNEQNNMCQTVETCGDYVVNKDTTDTNCKNIHQDCTLVTKNNVKSYCLLRISCYFYNSEQDCKTFNINDVNQPYYKLSQQCKWDNKKCRDYQCSDADSDMIACGKFLGCYYSQQKSKCVLEIILYVKN